MYRELVCRGVPVCHADLGRCLPESARWRVIRDALDAARIEANSAICGYVIRCATSLTVYYSAELFGEFE